MVIIPFDDPGKYVDEKFAVFSTEFSCILYLTPVGDVPDQVKPVARMDDPLCNAINEYENDLVPTKVQFIPAIYIQPS